jgi:cytochrome b561
MHKIQRARAPKKKSPALALIRKHYAFFALRLAFFLAFLAGAAGMAAAGAAAAFFAFFFDFAFLRAFFAAGAAATGAAAAFFDAFFLRPAIVRPLVIDGARPKRARVE